jgi:hypothetical protein
MKAIELVRIAAQGLKEKVGDYLFKNKHRKSEKNFTRKRKLSFKEVILIMLNFKTKSNAIEVYDFATEIGETEPATRQAFEKQRDNIGSSAFKELYEDTVKLGTSVDDAKLFHGYRLGVIDGTTVLLPLSEELKKKYGATSPLVGKTYARISICVDVLNEFILDGEIAAYEVGERKLAMMHIKKNICHNLLYMYDRGYWSCDLIAAIFDRNQKFLMRIAGNSIPYIANSTETSGNYTFVFNKKEYTLRYYKFRLPSGEVEYLVTNLSREEIPDSELEELYHLRWGVETKYNELKNRLEFESFTGKSVNVVEQDFYASLVVMNLTGFAITAANAIVQAKLKNKDNKHAYKPNGNMAIGILKNRFIEAVIENDPVVQANMIDKLVNDISRYYLPIKPGRSFPRSKNNSKHRRTRRLKKTL